jgi:hypothetical protein
VLAIKNYQKGKTKELPKRKNKRKEAKKEKTFAVKSDALTLSDTISFHLIFIYLT